LVMALGLPLQGAFIPVKLHRYFKPKLEITAWNSPVELVSTVFPEGLGFLISRTIEFIDQAFKMLGPRQHVIVSVDLPRGSTQGADREGRSRAQDLLLGHGLHPVFFLDTDNGGAMDTCHVFGFGNDLDSDVLLKLTWGLAQTLHHFSDGGVEGHFTKPHRVARSDIPEVDDPPRKVLCHSGVILPGGLFPCH
jgi:hypothetical protein